MPNNPTPDDLNDAIALEALTQLRDQGFVFEEVGQPKKDAPKKKKSTKKKA